MLVIILDFEVLQQDQNLQIRDIRDTDYVILFGNWLISTYKEYEMGVVHIMQNIIPYTYRVTLLPAAPSSRNPLANGLYFIFNFVTLIKYTNIILLIFDTPFSKSTIISTDMFLFKLLLRS